MYHRPMRSRLAWLAGGLGVAGAVLFRALRRRAAGTSREPGTARDPRAAELRRKLAESRGLVDEREEFEAAETTVDQAEPAAAVEERRRRIHEQSRAAVEEMQRLSPEG